MIHIPILRAGKTYRSLDLQPLPHFQSGETVAEVSQANPGMIARDLRNIADAQSALQQIPVTDLLEICKKTADQFLNATLPIDENSNQSADDYVQQLSATTGMPASLCRANMGKIAHVLENMGAVLGGLTRGLDLSILDSGYVVHNDRPLSFLRETNALGAILPSNSPGVHSLWVPAIPLKVPLVLKPGSQEPWTPLRIARAFIAAGAPPEAFNIYPTNYTGAAEILLKTGRSMLFGDKSTVAPWKKDPRVQIHGPGWSKIIIGEDLIDRWEEFIDVIVDSAAANGGRSCINASGVWVPRHGKAIADAIAKKFAEFTARPLDDPAAQLPAFANPLVAERISEMIDSQLTEPGAIDVTETIRGHSRLVRDFGCTFLLPTVTFCADHHHPLANTEFLFPYLSVCESPQNEILQQIGSSLVVTAITNDEAFIRELFASPNVERLNIGALPTYRISWDQPHEGNLFEHLYRQRALQLAI